MAGSRNGWLPMAAVAAAGTLGGCVDMFTQPPPDAVAWQGTTTVGNADFPECGTLRFELGQFAPNGFLWDSVSGRARPTARPDTQIDRWVEGYRQWWLEGYVTEANFVQLETKLQQPIYFGARPYAVWRGTIAENRLLLTESGSPCNREVVLVRG